MGHLDYATVANRCLGAADVVAGNRTLELRALRLAESANHPDTSQRTLRAIERARIDILERHTIQVAREQGGL